MNLNTKAQIQDAFASVFSNNVDDWDLQHETRMVMYRFLSEVERLCEERGINKKQLAQKIGTSASFITQLFRGSKTLNLETIAKFQNVFDIKFEIKAKPAKEESLDIDFDLSDFVNRRADENGYWVYVALNKNFKASEAKEIEIKPVQETTCKLRVA
jgi:transcriptional regulator with XRE-family HTH domain